MHYILDGQTDEHCDEEDEHDHAEECKGIHYKVNKESPDRSERIDSRDASSDRISFETLNTSTNPDPDL